MDRSRPLQEATVRVRSGGRRGTAPVDGGLLSEVAAAAGAREVVRFAYADHAGSATERRVEPYRLVSMGSRWYLVAYDLVRDDWRTFRLDRMSGTRSVGHRFRARPLPEEDVAAYVARKTRQARRHVSATVRVHAPADRVERRLGSWNVETVEVVDADTCLVRLGGGSMADIAFWLGMLDADFEVVDSPGLAEAVRNLAERYARAL